MLQASHLTSSGSLGRSLATSWGRNDAAVNLVFSRVPEARTIAILGGGICEQITVAASRFLNSAARVSAFDSARNVDSVLRRLVAPGDACSASSGAGLPALPTARTLTHLQRVGVDTSSFRIRHGRFRLGPGLKRRLTSDRTDVSTLLRKWRAQGHRSDVLVCNNVLPNISVASGPTAVPKILDQCADVITASGVVVLGVVDSQLYQSEHPRGLAYFSAEIVRALGPNRRLRIDGWFSRAWVRERVAAGMLFDGYSFLILRLRDAPPLFADVRALRLRPRGIRSISQRLTEAELLTGRVPYVFAATCTRDGEYCTALSVEAFPNCVARFFRDRIRVNEISFRFCESLLPKVAV